MVIRKSVTTGDYLYLMFRCLSMKRTADSKTESKLDTSLEPTSPKKTVELKFTNYIFKLPNEFTIAGLQVLSPFT